MYITGAGIPLMVTEVPFDEVSGKGVVVTVWGLPVDRPVPKTLISIPGAKDFVKDAAFPTDVTKGFAVAVEERVVKVPVALATTPPALDAHASKWYVVLGLNPVILKLNITYPAPAPTSSCGVSVGKLQPNVPVLYWNQAFVSDPLGFTGTLNVAVLLVTADAVRPLSEGSEGGVAIKLATVPATGPPGDNAHATK